MIILPASGGLTHHFLIVYHLIYASCIQIIFSPAIYGRVASITI
jgi:hypothetical protein